MCLAIPAKIIELNVPNSVVEVGGVRRAVNVSFVPDVQVGDHVLVHAGFAIRKCSEGDVQEWNEIASELSALENPPSKEQEE